MRINRFLALTTGISRRDADEAVASGRVKVNGHVATLGQQLSEQDIVTFNDKALPLNATTTVALQTILLNKPRGYVCSRNGQGSRTVYELLPKELHQLKPVGRLDKDSSGLLLLTNDGAFAHHLTHPRFKKEKVYEITLNMPLQPLHQRTITAQGVMLDDGLSTFALERLHGGNDTDWKVTMREGRNRQIRRTFAALGYNVTTLHRVAFGPYTLGNIKSGTYTYVVVDQ